MKNHEGNGLPQNLTFKKIHSFSGLPAAVQTLRAELLSPNRDVPHLLYELYLSESCTFSQLRFEPRALWSADSSFTE